MCIKSQSSGFFVTSLHGLNNVSPAMCQPLGLCLGAQLMADVLGVTTRKHPENQAEYGYYPLIASEEGKQLFPDDFMVLEAHWEGWFALPAGAVHLASTAAFPQQAFRYGDKAWAFSVSSRSPSQDARALGRTPPG